VKGLPGLSPKGVVRLAVTVGSTVENALEVIRFGGVRYTAEPAPFDVADEGDIHRVRHYFADDGRGAECPPILLIPPLMLAAEVYDVSPKSSAVRVLADAGLDVWGVDFGSPENEEGGMQRTMADHVLAVDSAIETVFSATSRDIFIVGYSQGGLFAYEGAAYRRSRGIAGIAAVAAPVNFRGLVPVISDKAVAGLVNLVGAQLSGSGGVPGWLLRNAFQVFDPIKTFRQRAEFLLQLHNREALLAREPQRRFVTDEGWVAFPGPALGEFFMQFLGYNRLLDGGLVVGDRPITLADVTCPILCVTGEHDSFAVPRSCRAVQQAAPVADVREKRLAVGHLGLALGSIAMSQTWPTVADWVRWCTEGGDCPEGVTQVQGVEEGRSRKPAARDRIEYGLGLINDITHDVAATVQESVRGVNNLVAQLPRLRALSRYDPDHRVSLSQLLDERAGDKPGSTFLLFGGRGYTHADSKHLFDTAVHSLLAVGVRQGDHVGVLIATHVTALAVTVALNRIGAVAVLMRPDGSIEQEAELGQVSRIVADPENSSVALTVQTVPVIVLRTTDDANGLEFDFTGVEDGDWSAAQFKWYSPNPGRGRDLFALLFTGVGNHTRVNRITNRRWALSAYGTAAAASLNGLDTVYAPTPFHHSSCLLTCVGGAVAGGARLALASQFDPRTFWDEVRRYGVTAVSYTWTLVNGLLDSEYLPFEAHSPVRIFLGSGMPQSLWHRTLERFPRARVVEFYASTEGGAVLANVAGTKVGAKGRPLPGSVDVEIAAYDLDSGRLIEEAGGFVRKAAPGEVGMLLARADPNSPSMQHSPLRGIFVSNDAWNVTGDLFYVDDDGDFWFVDSTGGLVMTREATIASVPVEEALMGNSSISLAAVYGVHADEDAHETLIAAVQLRPGKKLEPESLNAGLRRLPANSRPSLILVVDEMPLSTWYRPAKKELRAKGIPTHACGELWRLDQRRKRYVRAEDVAPV
jgi:putative long chain acyl-CoA synthase